MAYTLGRGWIEMLRIDNVELQNVGGLRFNVWTSIVLFVAAAIYFVVSLRRHPGREESVYVRDDANDGEDAAAPRPARPETPPPEAVSTPAAGSARAGDRVVA